MVQTTPDTVSTPSTDQPITQRKKQAKREAKTMLAIERAKTKVQKAEQKVAKAQGKAVLLPTRCGLTPDDDRSSVLLQVRVDVLRSLQGGTVLSAPSAQPAALLVWLVLSSV